MSLLLPGEAGEAALNSASKGDAHGGIERKSTRAWARDTGYNPQKLFAKVCIISDRL